ncbi:ABC1 kinase family protein [Actinomadura roseirufa]|uniref:ABC1 kinase family protein n=1 Tax=Actinomadura roseirufa TaxID=2094049 RepID=UPI001041008F|nr:AarF/ABC1/UbiB kinase family protein [Actinomadura roseirufa]
MSERNIRSGRVARTAPLVGLAGRTAGEAVVGALRGRPRDAAYHERAAARYAERLGRSKGVLMKAGQLLSFVSFSVEGQYQPVYQQALARLQDDAPPMPFEMAAGMVEAELGAPPSRVFAEFDPEPLAAASIGQVHRALTHDGRRVAVKVQYPGVEKAIKADLANTELLTTFFQISRGLIPGLGRMDLRALAAEVAERIGEEVDYLTEADHQREFAEAYRGHPFVRVPEVVPELSTRRILTMDLVKGKSFREALEAPQPLRDQWSEVLFRFYLGGIRRLRLFHADPHPGNYVFHDDGTVTFLDFGCVKRFDERIVQRMVAAAEATIAGDAGALMEVLIGAGELDREDPPPREEVLGWWTRTLLAWTAPQPFTYSSEVEAAVARQSYDISGEFGGFLRKWRPDPEMMTLTRIGLGMNAVLARFQATGEWERIRHEWDRGGPPATPLGELDLAFWDGAHAR